MTLSKLQKGIGITINQPARELVTDDRRSYHAQLEAT
jgi:hypothetical protein